MKHWPHTRAYLLVLCIGGFAIGLFGYFAGVARTSTGSSVSLVFSCDRGIGFLFQGLERESSVHVSSEKSPYVVLAQSRVSGNLIVFSQFTLIDASAEGAIPIVGTWDQTDWHCFESLEEADIYLSHEVAESQRYSIPHIVTDLIRHTKVEMSPVALPPATPTMTPEPAWFPAEGSQA